MEKSRSEQFEIVETIKDAISIAKEQFDGVDLSVLKEKEFLDEVAKRIFMEIKDDELLCDKFGLNGNETAADLARIKEMIISAIEEMSPEIK